MADEPEKLPNIVDQHVGERIRRRRRALGLSQDTLADSLGLTFQQVQKYERGTNRVSASKLYQIAQTLQVTVSYFFEGLADTRYAAASAPGVGEEGEAFVSEQPLTPEERQVVAWLQRIDNRRLRRPLLEMIRTLAEEDGGAPVAPR